MRDLKDELEKILTVLLSIVSAENGQSLADSCSNHEGVCCTEAILIWLSELEFIKIQSELAYIRGLLNGYLTCISTIFTIWILRIHKNCFILTCCSTASELNRSGLDIGTFNSSFHFMDQDQAQDLP